MVVNWILLLLEAMGVCFLVAAAAVQQKRMGRRRREMQDWVAPEIPLDVLIEILARLPAKSVMRFKCTSKFWSSLLCSRYFCNRFLELPSQPRTRLYMCLLDRYDCSKSLLLTSAGPTCPYSFVIDQDLTSNWMGGYFLRLVRGFICFAVKFKARIYNPSTRQLVILPDIEESDIIGITKRRYSIVYFFGHDPVNDQYKLLCTITDTSNGLEKLTSEYWVFLLEAGGAWKRVANNCYPHLPDPPQLTMNGVLYYLAWTHSRTCVLVSFDIRSEELDLMQVHHKPGDVLLRRLERMCILIEYGGKLAVFDFTYLKEAGTADLWVVEDYRKKEWSTKTLVLQPSQLHLLTNKIWNPKALNGKVFLVPDDLVSPFYILCYDLQINDLKKVEIKGIPKHWFSKPHVTKLVDMEFMDPSESENVGYLET